MTELSGPQQHHGPLPSLGHTSIDVKINGSNRPRSHSNVDAFSPVNNDGCFEFDRVIKSGYVQKRTQKTKVGNHDHPRLVRPKLTWMPQKWKSIYLVLRPNTLSMYKDEKETKLRHQIYLSDLTAVAFLKDPKQKRKNVFGLFSPSRNFHFQAPTTEDTEAWVELIRRDARIEEEEEEMFLASPIIRRQSPAGLRPVPPTYSLDRIGDNEHFLSSSPEPFRPPAPRFRGPPGRRKSSNVESSGLSGNELASHSDFSDNDIQRTHDASIESLAVQSPPIELGDALQSNRPSVNICSASQVSITNTEQDPDRVIWQGWLWFLRTKRGVRQWKQMWTVLRPRNLILYKDESEYTAQ